MTLQESLRQAILTSGVSLYRIAQESGVSYGMIHRFAHGERDLRLESAGRIAAALGLHLTKDKRRKPVSA